VAGVAVAGVVEHESWRWMLTHRASGLPSLPMGVKMLDGSCALREDIRMLVGKRGYGRDRYESTHHKSHHPRSDSAEKGHSSRYQPVREYKYQHRRYKLGRVVHMQGESEQNTRPAHQPNRPV